MIDEKPLRPPWSATALATATLVRHLVRRSFSEDGSFMRRRMATATVPSVAN